MQRLFVSLYLSLAVAFAFFMFAVPAIIESLFEAPVTRAVSRFTHAPQQLFESELRTRPEAQWPDYVRELASEFGYDLELKKIDEIGVSPALARLLRDGRPATPLSDDYDKMYLPMRGTDFAVIVHLEDREHQRIERSVRGFYFLLDKQLQDKTRDERQTYLTDLSTRFDFPFAQVPIDTLSPSADERAALLRGDTVGRDFDGPREQYMRQVAGTNDTLVIGPIPTSFLARYGEWVALTVLATVFGAAAFLWLRPLWRDMIALDRGAAALGSGQLDARVAIGKRSPLARLVATFNAMAERLCGLIGAQKALTDSVSHELRTPIARLRFEMERLQTTRDDDDRAKALAGMRQDIDDLDTLVDELLTFSRLENAAEPAQLQSVDIRPWLERILDDNRAMSGEVTLVGDIETGVRTMRVDPHLMARALGNLIRNAQRYARSQVVVTVRSNGPRVEIVVADDGPGIAPEYRRSIFEPFARAEASRNRDSGGYGLGLAIVKRICDWHEATVQVASSAQGGASFSIELA